MKTFELTTREKLGGVVIVYRREEVEGIRAACGGRLILKMVAGLVAVAGDLVPPIQHPTVRKKLFVCGGIGITPFLSTVRERDVTPPEFTNAIREHSGLEADEIRSEGLNFWPCIILAVLLYVSLLSCCGIGIGGHEATTVTDTNLHNDYGRELDMRAGAYNKRMRTYGGGDEKNAGSKKTNRME